MHHSYGSIDLFHYKEFVQVMKDKYSGLSSNPLKPYRAVNDRLREDGIKGSRDN